MALDRSKFKTTVVATIVEQDKELASTLGRDGGAYQKYIKFEDGDNLLRIYPAHPEEDGGGDAFAEPKVTVFLPMMVPERDANGQIIMENGHPKLKESVKSVYNSRIHANTPKDLVEEYVRMSTERLTEDLKICQIASEKSKINDKLNRLRGNYAMKIQGLNYKSAWVMYVDRIVGQSKTFGPIEIGVAVKEGINTVAASSDSGTNPLATDPFTDLDNGRAVLVKYNKSATKPQDYYKVSLDNALIPTIIAGQPYELPRKFPLTDDQLEQFMKVTPLAKCFKNCFTRKDFELQFEGLSFFDNKYSIGLFQDAEFINVCEEIDAYYPEEEETQEGDAEQSTTQATAAPIVAEAAAPVMEESNQDAFDFMDRKELADWHKANQTGILIKPTMTDDNIRNLARQFQIDVEAIASVAPVEEVAETVEEVATETIEEVAQEMIEEAPAAEQAEEQSQATVETTTAADRMAAMRARAGIKKEDK